MRVPFKMRTMTEMERYRLDTLWSKEPETICWIDAMRPAAVFFDIGANVGVYSLYAASIHPDMQIYAFEPMAANYAALKANVKANGFANVHALHTAVGDGYGWRSFITDKSEAGCSGGQVVDVKSKKAERTFLVSLDGLCYGRHADSIWGTALPVPNYIKIDIDGQEIMVMEGAQSVLSKISGLLVEVSARSRSRVLTQAKAAGLRPDVIFNGMSPHSRERRAAEGIDAENIIFTR